jgi:tetratricopeptide (TPR) repeat protein
MRLNGVVEQQAYELRQLKEQSLERYIDIDRRLAGGRRGCAGGGDPGSGAPPATVAGARGRCRRSRSSPVRARPTAPPTRWCAARNSMPRSRPSGVFCERFPDGRYAPNAHYWLGELYLVIDPPDPEAARQSFMLLLNQYPDNAKVPDALYKLGRVQFIKGNSARAREYLEPRHARVPDSSAARLASDFIDQNL